MDGLLTPAATLEDVYRTLNPAPLTTPEQIKAFYRSELNKVRGSDIVERMARVLSRSFGRIHFKAFLMGHPGVGKSTEVTRLLENLASLKGEIKYAADRKSELVEYRLNRLSKLVELLNRLLDECNSVLKGKAGKEWLFVLEDFDKIGIPPERLREVFVTYGNVFQQLRAHMIITIPVWLGYSQEAQRLPFTPEMVPDTPVFDRFHVQHSEGRNALVRVLEARACTSLFAESQRERLVVASGGNLRDLFHLVYNAAENALSRGGQVVEADDVTRAITAKRRDYRNYLGESPYDPQGIDYHVKAIKLLAVYNAEPGVDVPDAVLYSLLRSRAVQQFNGDMWFGVHPLVVDILKEQRKLPEDARGGTT